MPYRVPLARVVRRWSRTPSLSGRPLRPRSVPRLCLAATSHSDSHPATREWGVQTSGGCSRCFPHLEKCSFFYHRHFQLEAMVLGDLGFSVRVAEEGEEFSVNDFGWVQVIASGPNPISSTLLPVTHSAISSVLPKQVLL